MTVNAVRAVAGLKHTPAISLAPGPLARPRVMIVGTGERAVRLAQTLARRGKHVVGAIDDELQPALATRAPSVPWLGGLERLTDEIVGRHVEELFVAIPLRSGFDAWMHARAVARRLGIPAMFECDLIDDVARTRVVPDAASGTAIHYNLHPSRAGLGRVVRRTLDLVLGTLALVLLAPAFVVAALAVALTSRGPILFRQERVGLSRRRFHMLKFRTMAVGAEALSVDLPTIDPYGVMFKAECDPRVTKVGAWLRRTSLDELPQLFNVLRGDMSLVGPRPMPTWVYDRVQIPEFHRRSSVLPGMTGLWQVSGREQNLERMLHLDLDYVDRWSVGRDVALLCKTPFAVLRGTGAR